MIPLDFVFILPLSSFFLQVMVATVRCEEISNEKFAHFITNEVM